MTQQGPTPTQCETCHFKTINRGAHGSSVNCGIPEVNMHPEAKFRIYHAAVDQKNPNNDCTQYIKL